MRLLLCHFLLGLRKRAKEVSWSAPALAAARPAPMSCYKRLFSRFIGELTVLRYQSVLRRYAEDTGDFVARSSLFEWFSTGPRDHIGLVKPIL